MACREIHPVPATRAVEVRQGWAPLLRQISGNEPRQIDARAATTIVSITTINKLALERAIGGLQLSRCLKTMALRPSPARIFMPQRYAAR